MGNIQFFPWQLPIAQQWLEHKDRFAHAWLIHGQEGIGKLNFCLAAAKSLLCENTQQGIACGHCQSCHWISLGNHLDFRLVLPDALKNSLNLMPETNAEEDKVSTEIRIEQIRELEDFMTMSTLRGGYRVVVLGPAESLNTASSNAILKILEEPAPHSVFLIFTHAIQKVLPTILSRCRRLPLPIPSTEETIPWLNDKQVNQPELWLAASSGAPLKALSLSESPYEPLSYWLKDFVHSLCQRKIPDIDDFVIRLEKLHPTEWMNSLQCFTTDLLLIHYGLTPRFYQSLSNDLQQIASHIPASKIAELNTYLTTQQRLTNHPLNTKLFIHATLQKVALTCIK